MSKVRCNSCGATYNRPGVGELDYTHACPPQIVDTPEVTDKDGNILTPAKFKAVANPRNENLKPNPDKPSEFVMISEGSGVTEVK